MLPATPRMAFRSTRALRLRQPVRLNQRQNVRFQSTESAKQSGGNGALAGGLAGGSIALFTGFLFYHFSGARGVVNSIHSAKSTADSAFQSTTKYAPEPGKAIQWLRETVDSYTKFIPGASYYVDRAFDDLEKIRGKHGEEVDAIVRESYDEMKKLTNNGFNADSASKAWEVLQQTFVRIGRLAGDAAEDILDNHPQLKEKVGGKFGQLKQMGEQYGPEAKKQVDETWDEVQKILQSGFSMTAVTKIQKLVQDKSEELKKYGDQAWQKGMEQAKPLLDKSPQVKELVENNKEKLLQGDLGQLWEKIQDATKSGNTDDLQSFVKDQVNKVSKSAGGSGGSSGIEQLLNMIPGGSDIGGKLQQLQEVGQKHGDEAEKLVKSAVEEIKKVLQSKVEEAEQLKNKAEKDVKN
ncbi:hypothetical protein WHR41_08054 [Cladosporium halotolerans]|uniref:Uncharacterized protein n=1 Tax=Cladosporium halotolerans TaxID=1052096 RepID=A0AB34KIE1_9PEZI